MFLPPSQDDRGWAHLRLAWHLIWPGWMAGMLLLTLGGLTNRQSILVVFSLVSIGRLLRLWSLSQEQMKLVRAERTDALLRFGTKITLIEAVTFGLAWFGWSFMQSPRFDPDMMLLRSLVIPWASLFISVATLSSKESNASNL